MSEDAAQDGPLRSAGGLLHLVLDGTLTPIDRTAADGVRARRGGSTIMRAHRHAAGARRHGDSSASHQAERSPRRPTTR